MAVSALFADTWALLGPALLFRGTGNSVSLWQPQVKIADFGLTIMGSEVMDEGKRVGTLRWMAPEVRSMIQKPQPLSSLSSHPGIDFVRKPRLGLFLSVEFSSVVTMMPYSVTIPDALPGAMVAADPRCCSCCVPFR